MLPEVQNLRLSHLLSLFTPIRAQQNLRSSKKERKEKGREGMRRKERGRKKMKWRKEIIVAIGEIFIKSPN